MGRGPEPRDAAALITVRDVESGAGSTLQVLMLRRRTSSEFTGGAYVFPGGAVDRADRDPETKDICVGLDDAEASKRLGVDSGGLDYFVAAIRECFEEAGLLFAADSQGLVSFTGEATRERFATHRNELNAGAAVLSSICRAERLRLAVDRLRYFSHWITPSGAPRRYDTRFFVGVAPAEQLALHDDAEVVASEWVVPVTALERHRAGDLDLMFPTVKQLESLCGFSRSHDLWDAATAEVPSIEPRLSLDGAEVRILLPGDPGFEHATGLPDSIGFPDRPIGVEGG